MKKTYKKVQSFNDILLEHFFLRGMVVIDVGCGTGDLVRWLTLQCAKVIGVDLPELIEQANKNRRVGDEQYLVSTAQDLTFKDSFADLVCYRASFHHIPESEMKNALYHCCRILKPGGYAVFIEPVAKKKSYYELTRLVEDEVDIQSKAYEHIKSASDTNFHQIAEYFYYAERSFQDFINLINVYVPTEIQREIITQQALDIIYKKNENIGSASFRSFVRLNIIQKHHVGIKYPR